MKSRFSEIERSRFFFFLKAFECFFFFVHRLSFLLFYMLPQKLFYELLKRFTLDLRNLSSLSVFTFNQIRNA